MRTPSRQVRPQRQAKQALGWGNPTKENARAGVDPGQALKSEGAGDKLLSGGASNTASKALPTECPVSIAPAGHSVTPTWGPVSPLPSPAFSVGPKKSHFSRINIMTTESNSNSQARIEALQNALKGAASLVLEIGPQIVAVARSGHLNFQTAWGVSDTETAAHLFGLVESLAESLASEVESLARDAGCQVLDDRAAARHAARFAARDDREGWE